MHQIDPSQGELSFELLAEVAVGATARIELCRVVHGRMQGDLVVVKRLHPHIAEDPDFVDMFRDEVWMTAALKHPHVVEVVGWGQDARGPWLAVEFVRGVSLQRLMKTVFETGERFSERMVVYLARSICDGLAEAHALRSAEGAHLNLVHRDLTPGNILLGFEGEVKITDFGLAKAHQRLTSTLTGLLKGQPQYMSPEQVQGKALDGRSDVFALGVVLFELFSGRRPWNAATDLDAMRAITDDEPADLFALRPKIDKALVEVVTRCLDKAPAQRFQSALELRDRFQGWLDAHGYRVENHLSLARFVRRNAMRQMRWFERAMAGEFADEARAQSAQQLLNQPVRTLNGGAASFGGDGPSDLAPAPFSLDSAPQPGDERPRADRPSAPRSTPGRRSEAKTRTHIEEDAVLPFRPRAESIEWEDEGPTLVQKSDEAREMIQRARERAETDGRVKASRRQRLPSVGEATTRRQRIRRPAPRTSTPSIEDEDSSEVMTRVGTKESVEAALNAHDKPDADATVQLDNAHHDEVQRSVGMRRDVPQRELRQPRGSGTQSDGGARRLGTLAPPDPDVPPLPAEPGHPAANTEERPRRAARASLPPPRRTSHAPRAVDGPPSDTITRASAGDADRTVPVELSARPSRPVAHTQQMLSSAEEVEPMVGALPIPAFPSDPSISGEVLSTDFATEARRMAALASAAANDANDAARLASAAKHAALLAGEAAVLAASGKQHGALVQLREAQRIGDAVRRGEVPEGEWAPRFVDTVAPPPPPNHPLMMLALQLKERANGPLVAVGVVGAILLVLLVVALVH